MCKAIEDMLLEVRKETTRQFIIRMLEDGTLTFSKIADLTETTIEEVEKVAKQKTQ